MHFYCNNCIFIVIIAFFCILITIISFLGVKAETDDKKNHADQQSLRSLIQSKAKRILESWSLLQEAKFKIPRTYRAAQRAQHEQEMEDHQPSPPTSEASFENQKIEAIYNR